MDKYYLCIDLKSFYASVESVERGLDGVKEFYLNYSKEATLGQELRILGIREENAYRMEGIGPNATCFTAMCVY